MLIMFAKQVLIDRSAERAKGDKVCVKMERSMSHLAGDSIAFLFKTRLSECIRELLSLMRGMMLQSMMPLMMIMMAPAMGSLGG